MLGHWTYLSYSCLEGRCQSSSWSRELYFSCLFICLLARFCSCVCLHPANTLVEFDKIVYSSALSSYFESGLHHVFLLASVCLPFSCHYHSCPRSSHAGRARTSSVFHAGSRQHKQTEQNGTHRIPQWADLCTSSRRRSQLQHHQIGRVVRIHPSRRHWLHVTDRYPSASNGEQPRSYRQRHRHPS